MSRKWRSWKKDANPITKIYQYFWGLFYVSFKWLNYIMVSPEYKEMRHEYFWRRLKKYPSLLLSHYLLLSALDAIFSETFYHGEFTQERMHMFHWFVATIILYHFYLFFTLYFVNIQARVRFFLFWWVLVYFNEITNPDDFYYFWEYTTVTIWWDYPGVLELPLLFCGVSAGEEDYKEDINNNPFMTYIDWVWRPVTDEEEKKLKQDLEKDYLRKYRKHITIWSLMKRDIADTWTKLNKNPEESSTILANMMPWKYPSWKKALKEEKTKMLLELRKEHDKEIDAIFKANKDEWEKRKTEEWERRKFYGAEENWWL